MSQPLVHVKCENGDCTYFDQVRTVGMLAVGAGVFQGGGLYCECRSDRELRRVVVKSPDFTDDNTPPPPDGRVEPPGATHIDHRPPLEEVNQNLPNPDVSTADQVGRTQ